MVKALLGYVKELTRNLLKLETIIFLLVFSSNFSVGEFSVSQFIYIILAFFFLWRYRKYIASTKAIIFFYYFMVASVVNYALYHNSSAFGSSLRFVFNLFIYILLLMSLNNNYMRKRIIYGYLYACEFFSLVIIVQFLIYYLLGINLQINIGQFNPTGNAYDPASMMVGSLYRTSGLFNEPSWYASFCAPCIFIADKLRDRIGYFVCLFGIIFSTSGVGYAVLGVYGLWKIFKMKPIYVIMIMIAFVLLMTPIMFLLVPSIEKISFENTRLAVYAYIFTKSVYSIWGVNPGSLYMSNGEFEYFLNTLSFVYLFWGIVGLLVFVKIFYYNKVILLTLAIIAVIAIEGLYGRIDFWMMLLACRLYNSELISECRARSHIKNNGNENTYIR